MYCKRNSGNSGSAGKGLSIFNHNKPGQGYRYKFPDSAGGFKGFYGGRKAILYDGGEPLS